MTKQYKKINHTSIICNAAHAYMQDEIAFLQSMDDTHIDIHPRVRQAVIHRIWSESKHVSRLSIYAKRIAMIALITCTVGFITCMCIPSVRSAFLNFFEIKLDHYNSITLVPDSDDDYATAMESIYAPILGHLWSTNVILNTEVEYFCELSGPAGEYITFNQTVYSDDIQTAYIDNDPTSTETVYLGSTPATLYTYPDGTQILLWLDRYAFTMVAENTPRETLLALAASVSPQ